MGAPSDGEVILPIFAAHGPAQPSPLRWRRPTISPIPDARPNGSDRCDTAKASGMEILGSLFWPGKEKTAAIFPVFGPKRNPNQMGLFRRPGNCHQRTAGRQGTATAPTHHGIVAAPSRYCPPTDTFRVPPGPSKTAVPPKTSRTVQPGMVFGLVSGVGVIRGRNFFSAGWTGAAATFSQVVFCCTI